MYLKRSRMPDTRNRLPIQVEAIPKIMAGHDLIGIAQTGTGKTAAFVLPDPFAAFKAGASSQAHGIRGLIVAPTRELVVQIEGKCAGLCQILANTDRDRIRRRQRTSANQSASLRSRSSHATPGRLLDLVGQRYGDFSALEFLVLDEADRMLDMGFHSSDSSHHEVPSSKRQNAAVFSDAFQRDRGAHA